VPAAVINQFNLKEGDKLDWNLQVENEKLIIVITPEKTKRK